MDPVTFTTQVTASDYTKLALRKVLLSNFTLAIYVLGVSLLFFLWVVLEIEYFELIILTVIVSTIMVIYPIQTYVRIIKASKSSDGKAIWKIDESGVEIISQNAQGKFNWEFFKKVTEDKVWVFLWYNGKRYTYFPKASVSLEYLKEIKNKIHLNHKNN